MSETKADRQDIPCAGGFLYPGACSDTCGAPYYEPQHGEHDTRTGHECCSTVASVYADLCDALAELIARRERACREVGGNPDGSDGRYARARAALRRARGEGEEGSSLHWAHLAAVCPPGFAPCSCGKDTVPVGGVTIDSQRGIVHSEQGCWPTSATPQTNAPAVVAKPSYKKPEPDYSDWISEWDLLPDEDKE